MISRRRLPREKVLQALYAHEISQDPFDHLVVTILDGLESNSEILEFAKKLLSSVIENYTAIDSRIKLKVDNWDFSRIALIDRIILRMGITELMFFPDIPPKVTIDEAIEIAKKFSTDESGKFVNGVLNAVLDDLKREGALHKTGRGLIGLSLPEPKLTHTAKGRRK